MNALLEIEDLHVHFRLPQALVELVARKPQRIVRAVNGVDLMLNQGEPFVLTLIIHSNILMKSAEADFM